MNCKLCQTVVMLRPGSTRIKFSYNCKHCNLQYFSNYLVEAVVDEDLLLLKFNIGEIINFYQFNRKVFREEDFEKMCKMKSFI